MIRARTQAREAALQALYQRDLRPDLSAEELRAFLRERLPEEALDFAWELVAGVLAHQQGLDASLQEVARNWTLKRMAAIDRNILRIGAFELLHRDDLPRAVSLNEAVLLAQRFSTKESGAFVNGILDKIRPPAEKPDQPGLQNTEEQDPCPS